MHAHTGMRAHAHNTHWCNGRKHIYKQPYSILMRQKNMSMAEQILTEYIFLVSQWNYKQEETAHACKCEEENILELPRRTAATPRMVFDQQDAGHKSTDGKT